MRKELPKYVPLRVRSCFSPLKGASSPTALVEKAQRTGLSALALTDEDNLYGAVPFFETAQDAGLKPLLGAIVSDGRNEAVLLVRDEAGYANLCEVLSARHLNERFMLREAVAEHQGGLFVLTSDSALAEVLARRLDAGRLWMELIRPTDPAQEVHRRKTAARLGLGLVATCDVHYSDPAEYDLHEVLCAMQRNSLLEEIREKGIARADAHLRTGSEMTTLFSDVPEALDATVEIADACGFQLLGRPAVFPRLEGDAAARLWEESMAGARKRYGRVRARVRARIKEEFDLISRMGFADYFLVVAEIVRHARGLGTPVAGRGSGGSSIIAYCLGITNADPLRFNLPFARFLNEGRQDYPDLDIDFCWRLRDDVIDYVYDSYGHDHVAMIATYATLQSRLAFREIAKGFGLAMPVISEIQRKLQHGEPDDPWVAFPAETETLSRILGFARRCKGFPHHLSVHCGGVVITPDRITRHVPLQRAAKGVVITQYDKDGVEAAGLVKLDLLGNRALSSVKEAIGLTISGGGESMDPETLPERDGATERLLACADTVGVCQLESPAMRRLLRQLRPSCLREVMKVLALIRPGAASLGMKEAFVRRARGLDPVPAIDPLLDDILKDSYGIMLFEDDALLVAQALTGLSAEEADRFRRAVTKCKSEDQRRTLSREFLGRCFENGVNATLAADLWQQMAKFNSYSFCRAHAASYARIAWANAWMKAHHEPQFWIGALNNNAGMYEKWVYIEEAKRSGLEVLLPCVNRSEDEFSLEGGAIRVGLGRVRELTQRTRADIYQSRPVRGLFDLVMRTQIGVCELENLIRAGGLDFTGRTRRRLLYELELYYEKAREMRGRESLFGRADPPGDGRKFRSLSELERRKDEWEMLSLSVGEHPIAYLRPGLERNGFMVSGCIAANVDRTVRLCGMVAATRTTRTRKGEKVCFITLSDEGGLFELTLSPEVYKRHRQALAECDSRVFCVQGKVEDRYDALAIDVEWIGALSANDKSMMTELSA